MTTLSGTSLVTTEPEAMTTLFPTVTPGLITTRPPIQTLSPIVTGLPNSKPEFLFFRIDRMLSRINMNAGA